MGVFASLSEAQEFFKADRFATCNGCRIDSLTDEEAVCSMDIDREKHCNAYGGVMGGVMFMLGDFAFAVASNHAHRLTVAMNVNISYMNAPKGDRLTARAKCLKSGRTSCVYDVDIYDNEGVYVARFSATGFKK